MQQHETLAILKRHVESAVSLIQNLKQKNQRLFAENNMLKKENEKISSEIKRYNEQIQRFESKMQSLEKLLDEAQHEQGVLEQSILTAISSLGKIDNISTKTTIIKEDYGSDELDSDEYDIDVNTDNELSMSSNDQSDAEESEEIGIF